jgi:hypothetical protein
MDLRWLTTGDGMFAMLVVVAAALGADYAVTSTWTRPVWGTPAGLVLRDALHRLGWVVARVAMILLLGALAWRLTHLLGG